MILNKTKFKKIKGDASFRSFYRKKIGNKETIIVFANKEKKKNLLIYDAINSLLIKNKILAPKLYNESYKNNFIEIQDFGNESVLDLLKKKNGKRITLYKKSVNLLNKIQKIKQNKIKDFKGKNYKIPIYRKNLLLKEAKLFSDWYVKEYISKKKISKIKLQINKQIKFLLSNLKLKNNFFVHRDFHASNLMKYKNQLGTIDTQDALIGNRAYDLASLIDDVRLRSKKKLKKNIYDYYLKSNKKNINEKYFLNDFQILSVLRNMKIIGIFIRLAKRDKKKNYLKLIPYAWKLIEFRMQDNKKFSELKSIFDDNFSKKMRNYK